MTNLDSMLSEQLSLREHQSQTRERLSLDSAQSNRIVIDGESYHNFSSNDYLGLANHSGTRAAIKNALDDSGFGSGASHLITGHHQIHQQLETSLAAFLQRDSAITFSTGYMANLGILQSLAKKGDLIIADKLNHASLIDGAKLSSADTSRYPHLDVSILESRLKKSATNKWVVTDGVFSMDGDMAPLDIIAGMCQKYQAHLIVDDAHGLGVVGQRGRGCAEHFGLSQSQLPILMGTFGKALGGFGAFVSGSKPLTDYLMQFARPYIYTTALPASIAAANLFNLQLINNSFERKKKLEQNIAHFRSECAANNITLLESQTAIQPLMIGDSKRLVRVNQQLKNNGFLVGAIRPPTVAKNSDRLRITLSAAHDIEQIYQLVKQLSLNID